MTIQYPAMPDQLTKSEGEILDYISTNPREFLQGSIGDVGKKLGVSGTTLSRFARRVGCGDYKGLKRLVARQEEAAGPAAKLLAAQQGFTAERWLARQQLCLQKTLEALDPTAFQQAVQSLLEAQRVFIHGKSASASLGQLRLFRLRRIIWNLRIVVHNEFSFISVYIQSFLLLYPNICLSVNLICQNNRIFPY